MTPIQKAEKTIKRLKSFVTIQSTKIRKYKTKVGGLMRIVAEKDKDICKLEKYIQTIHNESD